MLEFVKAVLSEDNGIGEEAFDILTKLDIPGLEEILDDVDGVDGRYFLKE